MHMRDHYTNKKTRVVAASSGLLISMHGMSVEARGPETGTSIYCGPIPGMPALSESGKDRRIKN